jgi:SpoVK/Ycf46/Vps4 family AAA+-type ATPase
MWRVLEFVSKEEETALYRWRQTVGLEGPDGLVDDTSDIDKALAAFSTISEPALLTLFDVHHFLSEPIVIRWIRDLCITLGGKQQSLLLLAPSLCFPEELEKSLAIIDIPLPTRVEGERLLTVLCKSQGIEIPKDRFERFIQGSLGLTEEQIKRLYNRILLKGNGFSDDDLSLQNQEKRRAIRRSNFLEFWDISNIDIEVGGLDNLKAWLIERSRAFSSEARAYGLPDPKGLFLLGVQGCGKSLMAKAVAKMWKQPLLRLDIASAIQGVGKVEESLRETIRIVESMSPAILWIDELEKGFGKMDGGAGTGALGYFLTWMQEKTKPVFVVATANEVRALPPELLRKGRFDEIFFVDLPDVHERLEILDIHLRRLGREPKDYDLTIVVEETERFSGAELEEVVISALFHSFAENRKVNTIDLLESAREIVPLAVTMDDHLKNLRDWARPRARRASANRRRFDFFLEWEETP